MQHSSQSKGLGLGSWVFQRWLCCLHGHRRLSTTLTYSSVLANGRIRELHFCLACESLVWKEHQPTTDELRLTWQGLHD
jgi:hypothetical protein